MEKETEFFIFLLQQYASYKKTTADKILQCWDECGITDKIKGMYEIYHAEELTNTFSEIDMLTDNALSSYRLKNSQ